MNYHPDAPHNTKILVAAGRIGTTSAAEATQLIGEGVASIIQNAEVALAPIAAGGHGTSSLFAGEKITIPTADAHGRLKEATYTLDTETKTAYIDAAEACGTEPGPDSYGLGVLVADAATRGIERLVIAIGDTDISDGGAGLLTALAVPPVDATGHQLQPNELENIHDFDTAKLNAQAAALEWVFLSDGPTTEAPEAIVSLTGVDPATPGIAVGITWLSALVHGEPRVAIVDGEQAVSGALDVSELIRGYSFIITAGPAAQAIAAARPEAVVGEVLEAGGSAVDKQSLTASGDLRRAGAALAADYLRMSTSQG